MIRVRGWPKMIAAKMRQPLGRKVVAGLWGNGTIRILTGFLTLFVAFYAKAQQGDASDWTQLLLLGAVGAAAGVGNMIGNGVGTRLELKNPPNIVVGATAACFVVAVLAAIFGNIAAAAVAALVASGTSAIGKVCLDSSIQDDLPDESRASAFGRSETVLQLAWVLGGAIGAVSRHLFGQWTMRAIGPEWPYGTFGVNVIGGLLMGLFVGWLASAGRADANALRSFVAVGVLGGFTTFSAFSLDFALLWQRGDTGTALGYALISMAASIAALFAGLALMRAGA